MYLFELLRLIQYSMQFTILINISLTFHLLHLFNCVNYNAVIVIVQSPTRNLFRTTTNDVFLLIKYDYNMFMN